MAFREYLCTLIENMSLVEMAFSKKECEKKISGLEPQINLHLIKILAFEDEINFDKHVNDIMNWLEDIQDLDFNKKGKKFSKDFYYHLLFEGPITDETNIKYIQDKHKRKLKKYQDLPRKMSDKEVLYNLMKLQQEIADLLSKDAIFDIEDKLLKIKG